MVSPFTKFLYSFLNIAPFHFTLHTYAHCLYHKLYSGYWSCKIQKVLSLRKLDAKYHTSHTIWLNRDHRTGHMSPIIVLYPTQKIGFTIHSLSIKLQMYFQTNHFFEVFGRNVQTNGPSLNVIGLVSQPSEWVLLQYYCFDIFVLPIC